MSRAPVDRTHQWYEKGWTVGKIVQERRLQCDIGARELGRLAGCSGGFIVRLEKDNSVPGENLTYSLARVLEIDPDVLFAACGRVPSTATPQPGNLEEIKATRAFLIGWRM